MKGRLVSIAALLAALGVCAGYLAGTTMPMRLAEEPRIVGTVTITIEKPEGKYSYQVHNLIVTQGKTRIKNFLKAGTAGAENATIYISLSNDSAPSESWTNLPNEITENGCARAQGTVIDENATGYKVEKKFTVTAGPTTVQCSGLNWGMQSGTLWAAATFSQVTLSAGDNLTITWAVNHL